MNSFKDIYKGFDLNSRIYKSVSESMTFDAALESRDAEEQTYNVKEPIRELFSIKGEQSSTIGGHPDFDELANSSELKNGHAVTLFVDIIGSTKLGVTYAPRTVFMIKNSIIKCAIETIQGFGGHVHRIMGDAVMAFFRSEKKSAEKSCIEAINCATYLAQFIKEMVNPQLRDNGLDEDIGIRMGLDYGNDEQVIWGKYGYSGSSEVTATSYYVDVAAKLQQSSPRNKIMVGENFAKTLGLHDDILNKKYSEKNGETVEKKYVEPNYKDSTGKKVCYRQYVINNETYYSLLPKPEDKDAPVTVYYTPKNDEERIGGDNYFSCATGIQKGQGVSFKAHFHSFDESNFYHVKFRVENHGDEACEADPENYGNHETFVEAKRRPDGSFFAYHWEGTQYRGLHYMHVSVWDSSKQYCLEEEKTVGIFVID